MSNFWVRTLAGIVFLAIMVFALIWDRTLFACVFVTVLVQSLREFYDISLNKRFRVQRFLGLVAGGASFILVSAHCFYGWDLRLLTLALIPLLLIPVSCLLLPSREHFGDLAYIYAGLLYIALPISLSPLLMMDGIVFDGWFMLSLFVMIWCSDVGAYCIGTAFGQRPGARKLAPDISPKKSWWGFWGGIVFCVAAATGLHFLTWLPFPLVHCIVLGVIVSVFGVCGDLFESLWKRHFGVKDSGACIPGHGGMLDRFDSSLVAIPMACVYLSLFNLI
jgi:CDP-diglyceride synthetase